jgi:uncharacterized protein YecE (DUF72 family)
MRLYVGTSGWVYDDWRGLFYPQGLPRSRWFEFYNRHFATVELNNTFYRLPSEKAVATWRARSSEGFLYAVKASRTITHIRKLRNAEEHVAGFLRRVQLLGNKLGPMLYQLPPAMSRNDAVLESFLELLPTHLQHVFEFRNESWFDEAVFDVLRKHGVGFCIYDMPGFTSPLVVTADFAYLRFHGSDSMYGSCYSRSEIDKWAKRIAQLGQGLRSVYVYFNNDARAFAVRNAGQLVETLDGLG